MAERGEGTALLAPPTVQEAEVYRPGQSTFTHTLINVVADIVGTGLLACPIAFAHGGWLLGTLILLTSGAVTLYSLKVIIRVIEKDRRLRNFTDIVGYALGPRSQVVVVLLVAVEICFWSISFVDLFGDSMNVVVPRFTVEKWKIIGLFIILPTAVLPLRYLAWTSAMGVMSTWLLVVLLTFVGLTKPSAPGSLRDPAHTDLLPSHGIVELGTVVGLLLSGFGGHGLIPNLVHDMRQPEQAFQVCKTAYGIAMATYMTIAIFGYLMFGTSVTDEVSRDLAHTPNISPVINNLAVLSVALKVITKLPLCLYWPSEMIFTYFNLHSLTLLPSDNATSTSQTAPAGSIIFEGDIALHARLVHARREQVKGILRPTIRVIIYVSVTLGGIFLPSFESLVAFLGSASVIALTVIVPISAGASVFGWRKREIAIVVASSIFAVTGTMSALWPDK